MGFRITGLAPAHFARYRGLDDATLAALGARRVIADGNPHFPCRITLEDAPAGEALVLLNWEHLDVATPYRARGPIYIRESATQAAETVDAVPLQLRRRTLSVRAYDHLGWMLDGQVLAGESLGPAIPGFFADPRVAFLHAHNAGRGCYAARIDRA